MRKISKKFLSVIIIFLLVGIGLSQTSIAKTKIEDNQEKTMKKIDLLDEKIKSISLKKDKFETFLNLVSEIIQNINLDEDNLQKLIEIIQQLDENDNPLIDMIKNYIQNRLNNNRPLLEKTLIISQGWNYNFNLYKTSKFELEKNAFSFWHYMKGTRNGKESKTLILRPDKVMSSKSAELFIGRQTGFMIRPTGLYIYQSNIFPKQSYTFFIGFANYAYAYGSEQVELNLPLT